MEGSRLGITMKVVLIELWRDYENAEMFCPLWAALSLIG